MTVEMLEAIRDSLVSLRMPRALEELDAIVRQLEGGEVSAIEAIHNLLTAESALREERRVAVALRTCRLAPIKTLEGFDFAFQPSLDRERVMALATLDFITRHETVHFLGPPGTGKSHLACALGVRAVRAGKRVYRTTLVELVESLAQAARAGKLVNKLNFYARISLLIVDEIGYLQLDKGGANLFFQLVSARYEKGSMILTSNRGFGEWGDVFGDKVVATALLDRLLHHAVVIVIEGSSYRLRKHSALMPDHVRSNASIIPPSPKRRGRPKEKGGSG